MGSGMFEQSQKSFDSIKQARDSGANKNTLDMVRAQADIAAKAHYEGMAESSKKYSTIANDKMANMLFGKDATERYARALVSNNSIEATFLKMGSILQGGLHAAATVAGGAALEATKLWTATFTGGIWGMSREITRAISSIIPGIGGQLVQGFANVFIQSAQAAFDWSIAQNQQNIKARAVTGKEGMSAGYGSIPGMSIGDISKWNAAAQMGGAGGGEKTGESRSFSYQAFNEKKLSEATRAAAKQLKSGIADSVNAQDSGPLQKAGMNAAKTVWDGVEMETRQGTHEVNVAEKLFQLGTSMGLSESDTGKMFADTKSATGDVKSALTSMARTFEVTQDAARRTGVSAEVFRQAIMGTSAQARMLGVDMKAVQNTVTMISKSQKELRDFNIDIQAQGPDITKQLVDRTKMSEAQHANLGMEMAAGMGIQQQSVIGALALSKYGAKAATGTTFDAEGTMHMTAGIDPTKNTNAEALKAMKASMAKETEGITDANERRLMMSKIGQAKYGLSDEASTTLAVTSNEKLEELTNNKEFTNSMKSSSQLAAETLTSSQRMESIQRNLVQIVTGLTVVTVGGFAQLLRTSIQQLSIMAEGKSGTLLKSIFGVDTKQMSEQLKNIVNTPTMRGMSSGGTMARGMNMMSRGVSGLNAEFKHQFGAAVSQVEGGFAYDMNSLREDAMQAYPDKPEARERYIQKGIQENPALLQASKESSASNTKAAGVPVKHSGGTFTGVSKVLTNEFFTPLSHHSGGVTGNAFTLDPSALNSNEAFMVSPKPMQVQTPSQFGKSQGANGPTYNMSFTITGVATKSDIIRTMTQAVNEAMG